MKNSSSDRRNNKRFQATDGTLAFRGRKYGRIVDISMGGLAIQYVDIERWGSELFELDIILGKEDFYLNQIPCESISDSLVNKNFQNSPLQERRHGIRFGALSPSQEFLLKHYILTNTTAEA